MPAPRAFYGWKLCLLGGACIAAVTSVMYSFGVFFEPIRETLSTSSDAVSLLFSANQFVTYAFAGVIGFTVDRRNVRILLLFGGLCTVAGLIGAATAPTYLAVLLSWGVVLAVGFGTVYVAIYATVARWFSRRRGTAMSILSVGFGAGALVGPPLAEWVLRRLAWEQAYLLSAVLLGALIGAAAVTFRNEPSAIGEHPDGADGPPPVPEGSARRRERLSFREAVSSRQFWLLGLGFLLSSYGFYALVVHFVPYADSQGLSPAFAAAVLGAVGGASIPARFGAGFVSDRVGRTPIVVGSIVLMAAALFGIVATSNPIAIAALVVLFGVGFGGQSGLYSALVADVFTVANVGRMIGLTSVSFALAGAAGPLVSGLLYERTGRYVVPFVLAGALALLGAALIARSESAGSRDVAERS